MLKLKFDMGNDEKVSRIWLDSGDLTGCESTDTVKDALQELKIENPAMTFAKMIKSDPVPAYYSDNALENLAYICNDLADIWRFDPGQDEDDCQPYMNPVMLLERALNMILEELNSKLSEEQRLF